MNIVRYKNIFLTRSGIGLKNFRLVNETIHLYKGKRAHFWKYAFYQFFFKGKIKLKGNYFVMHNHWCPGYYHWITEALPRLINVIGSADNHTLVLPETFREQLYDSVSALFKGPVFWIPQDKNLVVENLLIPENPPFSGQYHPDIFFKLREAYRNALPSEIQIEPAEKIYVSRSKAKRRKVENEDEVIRLLTDQKFAIVNFEDLSFWQQVALMNHAKIFVSIHGAGLSNMLFMKEGSIVVELQKEIVNQGEELDVLYKDFATTLNLKYHVLYCKSSAQAGTLYTADIIVDLNKLQNLITFSS